MASSRIPSLGPRGEGWVALQGVLLVALVASWVRLGGAWGPPASVATGLAGVLLLVAGGLLALRAMVDLGRGLTPLPRPRDGARLVRQGAYRLVRHPIYGGLVIACVGLGLIAASPAGLLLTVVLLGVFDLKSRREEAWLLELHPAYAAYRARTRRMLPGLY